MTTQEFSNEFDILYNNVMSNQAPGLDEYEKSVFLTKAQDEILKNYFNPKGNKYQEGYDDSPKRQIDFSMLMKLSSPKYVTPNLGIHSGNNTKFYEMPSDILLYINEFLDVTRKGLSTRLSVVPLRYDEYSRVMSKPYKRPLKNQAWRLITSGTGNSYTFTDYGRVAKLISDEIVASFEQIYKVINNKNIIVNSANNVLVDSKYLTGLGDLEDTSSNALILQSNATEVRDAINTNVEETSTVVEVIPGTNDIITNYLVRYIRKPRPIILETLNGLSINGEEEESSCELDSSLHQEILQRAVELAKAAYAGDINSTIELGKRSE